MYQPMNESKSLLTSGVASEASKDASKKAQELVSHSTIGERVRQARVAANMTQQELASATYSKSYISAVERGKMTPSFQALHILAERLGRPISFFLGEGEVDLHTLLGGASTGVSEEERRIREGKARQMLVEAEGWLDKNRPEEVLEALHVAANEPPEDLLPYERPRWFLLAGRAALRGHKFPEAIGWLERGLGSVDEARVRTPPTRTGQLNEMAERIRNFLGVCFYGQDQPAKALEYHQKCLSAIANGIVTDLELRLLIHKSLGNDYNALGRHEEAIYNFEQACRLAEDMNDLRQAGLAYWGLATVYETSGQFFKAEMAFDKARSYFEKLGDTDTAGQLHAMQGRLLTKLEDYPTAEKHLQDALQAAERTGNMKLRAAALGNMASLHLARGNTGEAVNSALDGLRALQELVDYPVEGQLRETLARAYEAAGDYTAAEQAYKDAIATLKRTQDHKFTGRTYERYGNFLAAQGRFQEAFEQLDAARELLERKAPAKES